MKQLIATTDVSTIRPVFSQGSAENIKRYNQLKKLFEQNKEYRVLAEPVPAGGQKIGWNAEYAGTIIPFSKLSAQDQQTAKGRLKYQINLLYKAAIRYLEESKGSESAKKELFQVLDTCIEIPSYNDIYVIEEDNGLKNFVIIRWGFNGDDFNSQGGLIEKLVPLKVNSIAIKAINRSNKPVANEKITIEILGKKFDKTTDRDGKIYFEDIPFFTKFTAYQIEKGDQTNLHEYVCDHREEYLFEVAVPNKNMTIKVTDIKGKPMPDTPINIEYNGKQIQTITDSSGIVLLENMPIDTSVECYQTPDKKQQFICSADIDVYQFYGELPKINIFFKVLDDEDKCINDSIVKFSFEGKNIELQSDASGIISVGELSDSTVVNASQLVEGKYLPQQKFTIQANQTMYIIKGVRPLVSAVMNFYVIDENNQAMASELIRFEYDGKLIEKKSNEKGKLTLGEQNFGLLVKCSVIQDGVPKHQYTFTHDKTISEHIIKSTKPIVLKKFANLQIQIVNKKKEPIPNLQITLENGKTTLKRNSDDNGNATFAEINCNDEIIAKVDFKGSKVKQKIICQSESEFVQIIVGNRRCMWWLWLLLLLLLLGLLFYFLILPRIKDNGIIVVTDTVVVKDTIIVKDTIPVVIENGLKIKIVEKNTDRPILDAEVKLECNNQTYNLKTDSNGIAKFEQIKASDGLIKFTITAKNFKEQLGDFSFVKEKTFYLSQESLDVSEAILPCGQQMQSRGYGSTIKTFFVKKNSGTLKIEYEMFGVPDELIVYKGRSSQISPDKIIWKTDGYVKFHGVQKFEFESPDSLVTIQINGGEKITRWYFTLDCPK